jgi:hypothetical protein
VFAVLDLRRKTFSSVAVNQQNVNVNVVNNVDIIASSSSPHTQLHTKEGERTSTSKRCRSEAIDYVASPSLSFLPSLLTLCPLT